MGELMRLNPADRGAMTLADNRAAVLAAIGSQACYLLDQGYGDAAAKALTPALRSSLPVALAAANTRLDAADPVTIMNKLTPALALTAGAGMTGGARTEWLTAAADALKGIPHDLLDRGVRVARSAADHPSKIIPLILAEVKDQWRVRLRERGAVRALAELAAHPLGVNGDEDRCTPADAREILKAHGMAGGEDPSRPTIIKGGSDTPGRRPTRADYLRMGVDPAVLDAIEAADVSAAAIEPSAAEAA